MTKHYIIVGGTSGIGRELVQNLVQQGHQVTTISRRSDGIPGVNHLSLDITRDDLPVDALGPIHGVAYCPGSINLRPLRSLSLESFEEDWRINVYGAFRTIKALIPQIDKETGGSVLLFSTVAVQQGMPFHISIGAAKGAVEGMTRSLAAELAPGIRVNCIAPSLTETPLAERLLANAARRQASEAKHPLKRLGTPQDIARLGCFLLTGQSAWITGQVIGVDGGMSTVRI